MWMPLGSMIVINDGPGGVATSCFALLSLDGMDHSGEAAEGTAPGMNSQEVGNISLINWFGCCRLTLLQLQNNARYSASCFITKLAYYYTCVCVSIPTSVSPPAKTVFPRLSQGAKRLCLSRLYFPRKLLFHLLTRSGVAQVEVESKV